MRMKRETGQASKIAIKTLCVCVSVWQQWHAACPNKNTQKSLQSTGICDTGRHFRHNFHTLRGLPAPKRYTADTAVSRPTPARCRRSRHIQSSSYTQQSAAESQSSLQSGPPTAPSSSHDATSLACNPATKILVKNSKLAGTCWKSCNSANSYK